jgi:ankyrin repeat protein
MMLNALDRGRNYLLYHSVNTLDENNLRILDEQYYKKYKKSLLLLVRADETMYFERLSSVCNLLYRDQKRNTILFTIATPFLSFVSASVDVNAVNILGETALHVAVLDNDIKRVIELLLLGASKSIRDCRNKTPLDIAQWYNFHEIKTILLS